MQPSSALAFAFFVRCLRLRFAFAFAFAFAFGVCVCVCVCVLRLRFALAFCACVLRLRFALVSVVEPPVVKSSATVWGERRSEGDKERKSESKSSKGGGVKSRLRRNRKAGKEWPRGGPERNAEIKGGKGGKREKWKCEGKKSQQLFQAHFSLFPLL